MTAALSQSGQRTPCGQRCWRTRSKHLASSSSAERLTNSDTAMMTASSSNQDEILGPSNRMSSATATPPAITTPKPDKSLLLFREAMRDAPWSCGNQPAYHSMINRRSVPALHRACLHQRQQPGQNARRNFASGTRENGHDSGSQGVLTGDKYLIPPARPSRMPLNLTVPLPLLSAVTSVCDRTVKRCPRTLPDRLRRRLPSRWLGIGRVSVDADAGSPPDW